MSLLKTIEDKGATLAWSPVSKVSQRSHKVFPLPGTILRVGPMTVAGRSSLGRNEEALVPPLEDDKAFWFLRRGKNGKGIERREVSSPKACGWQSWTSSHSSRRGDTRAGLQ